MTAPPERVWGTPVRLKGGHLTHWAGRDQGDVRLLAHDAYVWAGTITEPRPGSKECQRCVRRQPFFVKDPP